MLFRSNMPKAKIISMRGKTALSPERARASTPRPIKMRSTMLYKAFTTTPVNAGRKYFHNRERISSSSNSFIFLCNSFMVHKGNKKMGDGVC